LIEINNIMKIDLRTLLTKLNPACKLAMHQAAELCGSQTHFNVELEHFLFKLFETRPSDLEILFHQFNIDFAQLMAQLQKVLDLNKRGNKDTPAMSPIFVNLFQEAWLSSSVLLGEQMVRSGTVLLALLEDDTVRGMTFEKVPLILDIPRDRLRQNLAEFLQASGENIPMSFESANKEIAKPSKVNSLESQMPVLSRIENSKTPNLDMYTVDITELARSGKIDPIKGRDNEIRQIIDILLRRRQNNPILTGEAGVGKTAIVEGFAQRIVHKLVPQSLYNTVVRTLDLGLLQAGAGIKGEFENRLKSVISEVRASPFSIVLFIDEAHQLIGAGGSEGQGDAANLLKPALARGELRTIAATTWDEYKKYVEKDPALARRFQVIKVEEPVPDVAVEMLRSVVSILEKHHEVEILDEAVIDAVKLSQRYITGRQLPDKAISVLDTACARVAVAHSGTPSVIEDIETAISNAEVQLRLAHRNEATGNEQTQDIAALTVRLSKFKAKRDQLLEKLQAERLAVKEILDLRRIIYADLDKKNDEIDLEERDSRFNQLKRLEKGLEAIQEDEVMVPICVDSSSVADVISSWTGIPVGKMMSDEIHTVLHLKDRLAERVVGQNDALDVISRRVKTFRADLDDPGKPVGVFMLVGPSGVGKTETAFALADMLYGGERNMITINMSEFQESHSVSSLKGAPPGYIGYGKGGVLTEAVRRRPYSVILLDEMEKAHPDVLEVFFQVFDKGTMEDGEGLTIDFKNTLILLTSNSAQDVITSACQSGIRPPMSELVDLIRPHLLKEFSTAFLGRVVLVPYFPLGDKELSNIVKLKFDKLVERFSQNHHAKLTWDPNVISLITQRCTEVDSGARNIDFILTQTILPELSTLVLERISMDKAFVSVHMVVNKFGNFEYSFTDKPLRVNE
jgi:type VI secretion system protein VasG